MTCPALSIQNLLYRVTWNAVRAKTGQRLYGGCPSKKEENP